MEHTRSTVMACIDGSRFQEAVVDYAAWVSRTIRAPLKFLHNIEERAAPPVDLSGSIGLGSREELLQELMELENQRSKLMREQGKVMLDAAHQRALADGAHDVLKVQRHGGLTESLVELEQDIRVLVIGVRGQEHAPEDSKLGAHLETVIRALHRPILVVNKPFESPPTRCMIAYDCSQAATMALDMVIASPLFRGMECHLVHVAKQPESALLEKPAARLEQAGFRVLTASRHGDVGRELADYQQRENIQLTIMGAFGHSRLRELLFGSVTHQMLVQSRVPLLLMR